MQRELIEKFISVELLTLIVSYAIIVGAAVVKIPQINNVLRAKSAKGLNIKAIYLEVRSWGGLCCCRVRP